MTFRPPETGESTRVIVARFNDEAWTRILPALRAGRQLMRPVRSRYFYVDGDGGLTAERVKKLEVDGVLRRVGVDTYVLAEKAA